MSAAKGAVAASGQLSPEQARVLTDDARRDLLGFLAKLERLHDGAAHLALGYRSWAAYCQAEFGLKDSRAYQLLKAGRVFASVHNCGLAPPANEAQARELAQLLDEPDLLEQTWRELRDRHGDRVTASVVREAVDRIVAAERHRAASFASSQRRAARLAADVAAALGRADFRLGDFRDHIHALADESARLLLTDPPYGINYRGRPYFFQQGTIPGDKTPEQALALLAEAIELLHPKLAPQAHLLIFTCWRQQRHVEDLVEKAGFTVRSSLIWVKDGHGVGDCKHGFGPAHECIVHASRGNAPIRNRNGDVFHHPRVKPHVHPTQKPLGLLAELVKATIEPGQLVCDPFAGAASTLVAATATGRNAWGCELNPDWHNAGLERLRNPQAELALETGDDKEQAP